MAKSAAKVIKPKPEPELSVVIADFAARINKGRQAIRELVESHHIVMSDCIGCSDHNSPFDVCQNLTCVYYRELEKNL